MSYPWNKITAEITGQKFRSLTAVRVVLGAGSEKWECICDCGDTKTVRTADLLSGHVKTCGKCWRKKLIDHGHARKSGNGNTSIYHKWRNMKARCGPKSTGKCRKNYFLRGIRVCDRWLKFENFLADMGEPPVGAELDRINNNGNYEPGNCRWVTRLQNQLNKTQTRWIEFNGKTQCLKHWARELGIDDGTLYHRLKNGWSIERAFTIPPNYRHKITI